MNFMVINEAELGMGETLHGVPSTQTGLNCMAFQNEVWMSNKLARQVVVQAQDGGGWDLDKAIHFLNSNAYAPDGPNKYGKGQCSPFTPRAINAGFGDDRIPTNLAGSAYGPSLLKAGFTPVSVNSLVDYTPLKGDIAVMNGPPGSKTCNTGIGGPCGHIQMYNGHQWVSDFFQTRPFWPGPTYQNANPQLHFQIYRWGSYK